MAVSCICRANNHEENNKYVTRKSANKNMKSAKQRVQERQAERDGWRRKEIGKSNIYDFAVLFPFPFFGLSLCGGCCCCLAAVVIIRHSFSMHNFACSDFGLTEGKLPIAFIFMHMLKEALAVGFQNDCELWPSSQSVSVGWRFSIVFSSLFSLVSILPVLAITSNVDVVKTPQ